MKILHEEPDKYIIQYDTNQNQQEIPEKLNASMKHRTGKYHMPHQHETRWKTDQKGYDKSSNIGFERNEPQV